MHSSISRKNPVTTVQIVQNTVDQLIDLIKRTGFRFLKIKTVLSIFSKSKIDGGDFEVGMDNTFKEIVNMVKILGLIFDSKLYSILDIKNVNKKVWHTEKHFIKLNKSKLDYESVLMAQPVTVYLEH